MPADTLLQRLEGVRQTAPGQWLAKCPAHDDRTASLSIKQADDGRTLVHCFAGCGAADVVTAAGLTLADLFDKPLYHRKTTKPRDRRRYGQALAALQALELEVEIVNHLAQSVLDGQDIGGDDLNRLQLAVHRIQTARELAA